MEILAGLVLLKDPTKVPLPWYNRPALGLRSGTTVWVSPVVNKHRAVEDAAPPDILVSPLEPARLKNLWSFTIDVPERAGAIGALIDIVSTDCNIDLMETVTIDQRGKHRVIFVLQPKYSIQDKEGFKPRPFFNRLKSNLKKVEGAEVRSNLPLAREDLSFPNPKRKNVVNLYTDISEIRARIFSEKKSAYDEYDFDRVVISSNTESRFVRYIFPKKGAFELRITHMDRPKAIQNISSCLSTMGYNVLLSRVSKSSQRTSDDAYQSETILICEPNSPDCPSADNHTSLKLIRRAIKDSLNARDVEGNFSFAVGQLPSMGRSCESTLRIKETGLAFKRIKIPFASETYLNRIKGRKQKRIFVSMRSPFNEPGQLQSIKNAVFKSIEDMGMQPVDGFQVVNDEVKNITSDEVWARLWSCDAALFLAAGVDQPEWLTSNQHMEWGFARAICDKSTIICHTSMAGKHDFMMPRESLILYDELSRAHLLKLEGDIEERLRLWFR